MSVTLVGNCSGIEGRVETRECDDQQLSNDDDFDDGKSLWDVDRGGFFGAEVVVVALNDDEDDDDEKRLHEIEY